MHAVRQWHDILSLRNDVTLIVWVGMQMGAQYKSGEVARTDWALVRESPPWAIDAWGLGCLMQEVRTAAFAQPEPVLLLCKQPSTTASKHRHCSHASCCRNQAVCHLTLVRVGGGPGCLSNGVSRTVRRCTAAPR